MLIPFLFSLGSWLLWFHSAVMHGEKKNMSFASFEFAASPFIEWNLAAAWAVMLHTYHL